MRRSRVAPSAKIAPLHLALAAGQWALARVCEPQGRLLAAHLGAADTLCCTSKHSAGQTRSQTNTPTLTPTPTPTLCCKPARSTLALAHSSTTCMSKEMPAANSQPRWASQADRRTGTLTLGRTIDNINLLCWTLGRMIWRPLPVCRRPKLFPWTVCLCC